MGIVYILALFFVYQTSSVSKNHALLSILLLFITPLYLWSVIQIRPQQIGLLIGLILAVLIVKGHPNFKFFIWVLALYVTLVLAHVLSFILYSALFVLYLALMIALENQSSESVKKYVVVSVSMIVSWVVFILFPYSSELSKNMTWIVNSTLNLQMSVQTFYAASTLVLVIFLGIAFSSQNILVIVI